MEGRKRYEGEGEKYEGRKKGRNVKKGRKEDM
jgi:hypothetical protein